MEENKKVIPLSRILLDEHYAQVRGGINKAVVAQYSEIIQLNGDMEAIVLFYEGELTSRTQFLVGDGFHRIAAYQDCGKDKIPAILIQGSKSDALLYAMRNFRHGAPVTNAQKRKASEMAVLDAVLAKFTDKKLAFLIGVSPTLIGDARRGEKPKEKQERHDAIRKTKQKSNKESPAPAPVVARERKVVADTPTAQAILKNIEDKVNLDMVSEDAVVSLFNSGAGQYVWLPKFPAMVTLRITDSTGSVIKEAAATLRGASFEDGQAQITIVDWRKKESAA